MDRRQRKSREAIFKSFTELLSEKNVNQITVGDIIERANVGRATFYAHFETKDYLLKELCAELFCHLFDSTDEHRHSHEHIFKCDSTDSVFLHLLRHLQKNDNQILELLSCQNNELFLHYFKAGLSELAKNQLPLFETEASKKLPQDLWVQHISSTFIETVRWWMAQHMSEEPETIHEYFLLALQVS